jgi:hypothetical protein
VTDYAGRLRRRRFVALFHSLGDDVLDLEAERELDCSWHRGAAAFDEVGESHSVLSARYCGSVLAARLFLTS